MRRIVLVAICAAGFLSLSAGDAGAQTDIEIGKTTIRLQSPVEVFPQKKNDGADSCKVFKLRMYHTHFLRAGFTVPVSNYEPTPVMPAVFGDSYELELGVTEWIRPVSRYAVGFSVHYAHREYCTPGEFAQQNLGRVYPESAYIRSQAFLTDNIGLGIYNRIFLSVRPEIFVDLGVYGDWAWLKQFRVRYSYNDSRVRDRYRDGTVFLPFQAGVYAAIGYQCFSIYCRYRLTNMFYHPKLPFEPERMSVGIVIEL